MRSLVASRPSTVRAVIATLAPSAARRSAIAVPVPPWLAPVTNATRPPQLLCANATPDSRSLDISRTALYFQSASRPTPADTRGALVTAPAPMNTGRLTSDRAQATHAVLVDLAADLFAEQGYAETSIRDFARRSPVSLGAIYLHFKNKAELLVEAINRRIDDDLESDNPAGAGPVDPVTRLGDIAQRYPERRRLRALLVQAAAAAQTDDDARRRVRAAQLEHVQGWVDRYEANRDRIGIDPAVDVETAVLLTWAIELGLGMLEAFDLPPASPERWAAIQRRVARALLMPNPLPRHPTPA